MNAVEENPEVTATTTIARESAGLLKFKLPGDVIAKTVAELPDTQRGAIKWAAGYCRQRNLSTEEFGALLTQPGTDKAYSGDSVYQAFTGRRDAGSLDRFCDAVDTLRRRMDETASRASTFIETTLTRDIWRTCRTALQRHKLSFVFGPSQIGKTTALAEYSRRNNHGETVFIRMPTRGNQGELLKELAFRLGISVHNSQQEHRRRIMESFDERTLLIVDECHQCMGSFYGNRALESLDFLREIWDRRKCGMVLCGTDVFRQGLRNHKILQQLWLRGYRPLQLPSRPSQSQLAEFARAFGLEPATDKNMTVEMVLTGPDGEEQTRRVTRNPLKLEADVVTAYGLGRWVSLLEDAADMASEKGTRMTWGRVIAANEQWQQLEEVSHA
jgi:DNA transposition AAA+ family ATPase